MKKALILCYVAVLALTAFTSCQKDIENVNTSPYEAEQKKNISTAVGFSFISDEASAGTGRNIDGNVFATLVANADEKRSYARHYATIAVEEMRRYAVPASITLSQAILESDGGTSYNAVNFNNHFGIKCKSNVKFHESDCRINPSLVEQGEFAVYESAWFSFRSHSQFLAERVYYKDCFKCSDYKCWAKELERAGYGGDDKQYAEKLIAVIEYYGLQQYDDFVNETTNAAPTGKLQVSTWLLNNSHGKDTGGKRKTFKRKLPNGEHTVYEYELNRQIVAKIVKRCNDLGLDYKILVTETNDVTLGERVRRANRFEKQLGNTALVTIDHNAAGFDNSNKPSIASAYDFETGKQVASGMESHNVKGSQMEQFNKRLAENVEHFLPNWHKRGVKRSRFFTLRKSTMPATILELGFFDNYKEACFIMSDEFQDRIVEAIVMTMCEFSNIDYIGNGVQG